MLTFESRDTAVNFFGLAWRGAVIALFWLVAFWLTNPSSTQAASACFDDQTQEFTCQDFTFEYSSIGGVFGQGDEGDFIQVTDPDDNLISQFMFQEFTNGQLRYTPIGLGVDSILVTPSATGDTGTYRVTLADGSTSDNPIDITGIPHVLAIVVDMEGDGAVRLQVEVLNLNQIINERQIGGFFCRAISLDGSRTYQSETSRPIAQGDTSAVPLNTLTCDITNIPAGSYNLEFYEQPERLVATVNDVEIETQVVTPISISISLEQFDEGTIGIEQTEFARNSQRCKSGSFNLPFRWVLCPAITFLFNSIDTLYTRLIIPVLQTSPLDADNASGDEETEVLFGAWSSVRIIANVLFVIAFLVAILGQSAAGFALFSAYEIRKILPRLVLGVIGIQLSWYIAGFMVDLFNLIGAGTRGLILAPVGEVEFTVNFDYQGAWNELASTIGIIGGVTAGFWVGGIVMGLPLILFPIIAGLMVAFLTILIRRALIILLVILSPIAFVAWILPNTSNLFKAWWSFFWKALLMYPMIVALIALGELFARILTASNTIDDTRQGSVFVSLGAMLALFAPYFFIPFTFRFAGGVLATLAGGLDQRGKGLNKRLFGDTRDPNSYRSRRLERQRKTRQKRKGRVMQRAGRFSEGDYSTSSNKRRHRWASRAMTYATSDRNRATRRLDKVVRRGGSAVQRAGLLTGTTYADQASQLQVEANKRMARLVQLGNKDRVFAVLGDKHPGSGGSWYQDENGQRRYEGRDLDPDAILSASRWDRKDQFAVQAAFNMALQDVAGQEDKVRTLYEQMYNGDIASNFTQAERGAMIERAADFHGSHSPDYLYRDPSDNFNMSKDLNAQRRFMTRVNERLSDDGQLDQMGPSFWRGATEVLQNAEDIYLKGRGMTHGTAGPPLPKFDPSRLDDDEKELLKTVYKTRVGATGTMGQGRGVFESRQAADGSQPRGEFFSQARNFAGGGRDPQVKKDLESLFEE